MTFRIFYLSSRNLSFSSNRSLVRRSDKRMTFFTTSVDDWLDEKKKLDGAEGLWRIHDKLYDFTIWARNHPGGHFWIDTTRGTDITEAFENYHFSAKAESLLQNYYIKEAEFPRNSLKTFNSDGFFKKFKGKVLQRSLTTVTKIPSNVLSVNDGLAAAVFLTGLLGANYGIAWKIASGVLLGLLAVSSHGFLHSRDNWRVYYFNISLMSSREWRIIHVLSHHQFRGTVLDLEIPLLQPFSKIHCRLTKYLLNLLVFPMVAHLQFIKRCLEVVMSKKMAFHAEELVPFSFLIFLFVFGEAHLWETFLTWNHIILIGSFFYFFCGSMSPKNHSRVIFERHTQGLDNKDFGIVQLSLSGNQPEEHESAFSFLNSFRGNVLHYLCPSADCGNLTKLIPALIEVSKECNISLSKVVELKGTYFTADEVS